MIVFCLHSELFVLTSRKHQLENSSEQDTAFQYKSQYRGDQGGAHTEFTKPVLNHSMALYKMVYKYVGRGSLTVTGNIAESTHILCGQETVIFRPAGDEVVKKRKSLQNVRIVARGEQKKSIMDERGSQQDVRGSSLILWKIKFTQKYIKHENKQLKV